MYNVIHNNYVVSEVIVLFSVFFFESLCSHNNLRSHIVTLHMRVCQRSVIRDHQQKTTGKCQGLSTPNGSTLSTLSQHLGGISIAT